MRSRPVNGSVPLPALLEVGFESETNSGFGAPADAGETDELGAVFGLVVVAPLTAPLGFDEGFGFAVADCPAVDDDGVQFPLPEFGVHGVQFPLPELGVHGVQFPLPEFGVHGVQFPLPEFGMHGEQFDEHGGGVLGGGVDVLQPVWAGLVLAMPWFPSHS
jgi:hypothetical protein